MNESLENPRDCEHDWQPVSMVFETQWLDERGGVVVRQPDLNVGRVYLVCLRCSSHTYMATSWINYRLYGSEDREAVQSEPRGVPEAAEGQANESSI